MSLFKIAWRSIQQRGLASLLTAASMALGVMLVVCVLLIMGIVSESFHNNSSLGYNMIVGAKGGKLQLVLNTVYYLSSPVENIPYTFYQEFLNAEQRGDGRKGEFADLTEFAIPVCLGDYFGEFRVVGTTPQMFDDFVYDLDKGRKYEFAAGRNLRTYTPEHGYYEAVLGATVAREMKLNVNDTFSPSHATPDGDTHEKFFVVGVLAPSGTPNDRAAFINMEGFYLLEGHAKPVEIDDDVLPPGLPTAAEQATDTAKSDLVEARQAIRPLAIPQREVTAVLLRSVSPLVTLGLRTTINEGPVSQAVLPIREIYTLFNTVVGPIKYVLLLFTIMICVVSGVSILVSIYNSMSDRRHEIAVMRALGAGRQTVMLVVLLESIILALGGGLLGWTAGHLLIGGLASPFIEDRTGVAIGMFDFSPKINLFSALGNSPIVDWGISGELLLVPGLVMLAIIVGFLPALAAYRTDVAESL